MPFSSKVVAEAITTSLLEENEAAMTRAAPRLTPGNTFTLALESSFHLQIQGVFFHWASPKKN